MEKQIVYQDDNFRRYAPETVKHKTITYKIQVCADLIDGRWEHFVSYASRADMLKARQAHA